jgi:predicted amidohydrolase YtcJ
VSTSNRILWRVLGGVLSTQGFLQAAADVPAADTVLLNGEVLVFRGIEQRSPSGERGAAERPKFAEAVAISGGRIVFTGGAAEAKRYVGPATKVIDLGGRMVMPGIVDGHFHGTRATDCLLGYEGGTVPQILARLKACLDRPDQAALKGTGTRFEATYLFGDAIEPPGTGLTRHDLDRLDGPRPARPSSRRSSRPSRLLPFRRVVARIP